MKREKEPSMLFVLFLCRTLKKKKELVDYLGKRTWLRKENKRQIMFFFPPFCESLRLLKEWITTVPQTNSKCMTMTWNDPEYTRSHISMYIYVYICIYVYKFITNMNPFFLICCIVWTCYKSLTLISLCIYKQSNCTLAELRDFVSIF